MELYQQNADMQDLAHATAHLIHGSSEGRFRITYAPGDLSQEEIERVGYRYMEIGEAIQTYKPQRRRQGWNIDRRRRAVLFHSHAVGRPVEHAGKTQQPAV